MPASRSKRLDETRTSFLGEFFALAWQAGVGLFATGLWAVAAAQSPEAIEFNRDIRPILAENCYYCHGPDSHHREAGLRLDTADGLLGTAEQEGPVVAGQPEESELFLRISAGDSDELMPPRSSHKELTAHQIETIRKWIEQGASYQGHWSFLPISKGDPALAPHDLSESIDRLIDAELRQRSWQLSPEADAVTLARRLHFDLIGLPPKPAEVQTYLSAPTAENYEQLVERLLASPHFGERLAIWWLDLVRYADTVGYHGDQPISISPYRDYVIRAFNDNKPFDQFTLEQLAGDLLPNPNNEQRIASGYNRLGMMSAEGGVQDKEYLAKYIAERVRNVSGTWLGLTLGCAECHDHKFDPLTMRDFYRLEAFFADIKERGLYAGANDDGNWGPSMKVPTPAQAKVVADLEQKIARLQSILDTSTTELEMAQQAWEKTTPVWQAVSPTSALALGEVRLTIRDDHSLLATGANPETNTYTLEFEKLPSAVTGIRLEVLPDIGLPRQGPGRASNGNFVLSEARIQTRNTGGNVLPWKIEKARATYEQVGAAADHPYGKWSIEGAIDDDRHGNQWGWAIMEQVGQRQVAVFELTPERSLEADSQLTLTLEQNHGRGSHTLGCFRISFTDSPRPLTAALVPDDMAAILNIAAPNRSPEQKATLARFYRSIAPALENERKQLDKLKQELAAFQKTIVSTLITEAVPPRPIRVLARGNWMDESGELVSAGLPAILVSTSDAGSTKNLTRLDLARWLVSQDNPLTARVTVNRIWKLLFGAGLSRKLDDVGAQGEWPSHPELLDLLAADFQAHWDIKRLIKAIVMSRTYRQASAASQELREQDPYNRWLARQGRFRLEAELVRDNALAVSGLLDPALGGPSVYPYQPPGYWAYLNFPTREWQNSSGSALYRRGLYTHWQRQYLHPSLLAFDAPTREECTADRPRSNTPLQSLVLLNDPTYVEAARVLAATILQQPQSTLTERVQRLVQITLSRQASQAEIDVLEELIEKQRAAYATAPESANELLKTGASPIPPNCDPLELAAWTHAARTLFNLHEFVTRQ